MMQNKTTVKKHWFVLSVVCLMYAGTQGLGANTLGIYYMPVSEKLGILHGHFAMNVTISAFVTGIFSLFVPVLLDKISWKKMIGVGILCCAIGLFGMGLTQKVWVFNILGLLRGVGIALTTMVAGAAIINQWFEERNGLAISLAASFSGIASILFSPIFTYLIATYGWERTFMVHGLLSLLLGLPALLLPYTFNPADEGLVPYGATEIKKTKKIEHQSSSSLRDMLHISVIAIVTLTFLQTAVVGINQHLPSYGHSQGMALENTGIILSAIMIGNMFFKLLTGILIDRMGSIKTMLIIITLNILSLIGLMNATSTNSIIFYSGLYGSLFGTAVLYVVLAKDIFGIQRGNHVYSYIIFFASVAIAISNAGVGYVYDFTNSFNSVFWLGISFQLISLILLPITVKWKPSWKEEDSE